MTNHTSPVSIDDGSRDPADRWAWIERKWSTALIAGGTLVLLSLLVPVGLSAVISLHWLWPLAIVGLGVLAVVIGLLGLYSVLSVRSYFATVGAIFATGGGVAASLLFGLSTVALVSNFAFGIEFTLPMEFFMAIAFMMAVGYSVGFMALGVAARSSEDISHRSTLLMILGGVLLLLPVAGEILRLGIGLGPPTWIIFPVLVLLGLDTVGIGVMLRRGMGSR